MTARGHVLLALPVAIYVGNTIKLETFSFGIFVIVSCIGALFPDIDEKGSWIGRRFILLSWPIKLLSYIAPALKHRGVTHFIIVPIVIILSGVLSHNLWIVSFGIGWLMHTAGDLLTVGGIRGYFYPFLKKEKIVLLPDGFRFYTDSGTEHMFNTILLLLSGYLLASSRGIILH